MRVAANMVAEHLNSLSPHAARAALARCCGSRRWIDAMFAARPFASDAALFDAATQAWWALARDDWLEAFSHHPRIGERDAGDAWGRAEQAAAAGADVDLRRALAKGNRTYERRFGHVFLICATARTAEEMLHELNLRLENDSATELRIAAGEQVKITRLRLEKLVSP